jgi:hypothetical protein
MKVFFYEFLIVYLGIIVVNYKKLIKKDPVGVIIVVTSPWFLILLVEYKRRFYSSLYNYSTDSENCITVAGAATTDERYSFNKMYTSKVIYESNYNTLKLGSKDSTFRPQYTTQNVNRRLEHITTNYSFSPGVFIGKQNMNEDEWEFNKNTVFDIKWDRGPLEPLLEGDNEYVMHHIYPDTELQILALCKHDYFEVKYITTSMVPFDKLFSKYLETTGAIYNCVLLVNTIIASILLYK